MPYPVQGRLHGDGGVEKGVVGHEDGTRAVKHLAARTALAHEEDPGAVALKQAVVARCGVQQRQCRINHFYLRVRPYTGSEAPQPQSLAVLEEDVGVLSRVKVAEVVLRKEDRARPKGMVEDAVAVLA